MILAAASAEITATRPAGPAASRPVQSRPADTAGAPAFEPFTEVTEGEWAAYAALDGREARYDVMKAGPGVVNVRLALREGGLPLGLPAIREELRDLDPLVRQAAAMRPRRSARPATIEAAGQTWDAILYEDRWIDEEVAYVRRTWVSSKVPVYGIVRMELTGDGRVEARLELRAFGFAQVPSSE